MKYLLIPLLFILVSMGGFSLWIKYPVGVSIYCTINALIWVNGFFYIVVEVIINSNPFKVRVKNLFKVFLLWFLMYVVGVFVMAFYDVVFYRFEWVGLGLLCSWVWDDIKDILDRKSENENE